MPGGGEYARTGAMTENATTATVRDLMAAFAGRTGLDPSAPHPRRYLWTDAYAVCNYLELHRRTDDEIYRDIALRLVDQVHRTLGRHRDDDLRTGWISGLPEEEGGAHPTRGGLRIGKTLPEHRSGEPFDERLEWDRDGQYYHYLTKWMHALIRVSRATKDPVYLGWAVELARAAHAAFTYLPPSGGSKRMCWKMSIDLSRPLVPAMGQHDPLDGFVTYSELQAAGGGSPHLDLSPEIADMAGICRDGNRATDDPLGIGGLLFDAGRIAQLMDRGGSAHLDLLRSVLDAALAGLAAFARAGSLRYPAEYRLAFRELGLAGVPGLAGRVRENPDIFGRGALERRAEALAEYVPLADAIIGFWVDDRNRETGAWTGNRDINTVMLATTLAPGEFLAV